MYFKMCSLIFKVAQHSDFKMLWDISRYSLRCTNGDPMNVREKLSGETCKSQLLLLC